MHLPAFREVNERYGKTVRRASAVRVMGASRSALSTVKFSYHVDLTKLFTYPRARIRLVQKGLTTARITMAIMTMVGISLLIR
jgi:hypothetical protein